MIRSSIFSKTREALSNFDDKSLKLNSAFLVFAFLFGALILILPVHYILIALITMTLMAIFIIKPEYCYYLIILTIPLTFRMRFLPVSFSINDVLILLCTFSVLLNLIFVDKRVDFKTKIDSWIAVLLIIYFLAGITSINPSGILTSFKFLEAIIVFYLTVYFVRTNRLNISDIVRILIITALIQVTIGITQAVTGEFGASFQSARGYLGRLGIGSTNVWHGQGTFEHFNGLGNYLTAMLLFYIPIYYFFSKKKLAGKITLGLLFWGLIITYSRGSLVGLFAGFVYFMSQIVRNKLKFFMFLLACSIIIGILYLFLSQTSYVQTLNPRNKVWEGLIEAIFSSPRFLLFGAGLNSYEDAVLTFLPPDERWFAHNFYLIVLQEIGIFGFIIFFAFLITMFINTLKQFWQNKGLLKVLNLSVSLAICSVFFVSMFDHSYYLTYFKTFLFLMFGIIYAKNLDISHSKNYS